MDANKEVVLKSRPGVNGTPEYENFDCRPCECPPASLSPNNVRVETLCLSVDPAQRCQMNENTGADYLKPWGIGERIIGLCGVGVVRESNHPEFTPGDMVQGVMHWPWVQHFVVDMDACKDVYQKVDALFRDHPSLSLAVLCGLTSLIGVREKAHIIPERQQTMIVSGAAGSCGSIAAQVAKLDGCKTVIGICGSDEKCKWLTEGLGLEHAINYKTEDIDKRLSEVCPQGADSYFDNVGGTLSDIVISHMKPNSHIVLCGQISQYNKDVPYPPPIPEQTMNTLKEKNITRDRFLLLNYSEKFPEATKELVQLLLSGKLQYRESVAEGIENAGKAFVDMMNGKNIGKQIVHVADI